MTGSRTRTHRCGHRHIRMCTRTWRYCFLRITAGHASKYDVYRVTYRKLFASYVVNFTVLRLKIQSYTWFILQEHCTCRKTRKCQRPWLAYNKACTVYL